MRIYTFFTYFATKALYLKLFPTLGFLIYHTKNFSIEMETEFYFIPVIKNQILTHTPTMHCQR